jgi:lipid A 4'-phosphatase
VIRTHPTSYRSLWLPDLIWLGVLTLLFTLPFRLTALDIRLQHLFFRPDAPSPWFAETWMPWRLLYNYGPWPALATGLGALCFLLWTLRRPALVRWRRHALLVILTLGLGPGLLVNVIFKDHWGRPRPRQTTEFSGRWAYQPVLEKGLSGRGRSFPCGHSSMGFFFIVFYFVFRRRRKLAALSLAFALILGFLIGLARMAAGGHFASDVLWSGLFPAGVAFLLYYAVLRIPHYEDRGDPVSAPHRSRWLLIGVPLVAMALLTAGMAGTPAYTEIDHRFQIGSNGANLTVDSAHCDVELAFDPTLTNQIVINGNAQGFGWPWSKLRHHAALIPGQDRPLLRFTFTRQGHFAELSGHVVIRMPTAACRSIHACLSHSDMSLRVPDGMELPDAEFLLSDGELEFLPPGRPALNSEVLRDGTVVYRSKPTPKD